MISLAENSNTIAQSAINLYVRLRATIETRILKASTFVSQESVKQDVHSVSVKSTAMRER